MGEKLIRLYTRQNDKTLNSLEKKGRVINERMYVQLHFGPDADLFLDSYDWFTKEAQKRLEKPEDVSAPIWCSISTKCCLRPIENTVVYVLKVPEDMITLSGTMYLIESTYQKTQKMQKSIQNTLKNLG